MLLGTVLYIIYSGISFIIALMLVYLFYRRRDSAGASPMSISMLCAAEWTLSNFISAMSNNLQVKTFWDNMSFLGVVTLPVLWFIFCIQYTTQGKFIRKGYYLLSIIPVITLIIVFIPNLHHLIIFSAKPQPLPGSSISLLSYDFGIWFWIHAVYSYSLILFGILMLIQSFISSHEAYRNQGIIMISGALIPVIGSFLFVMGLLPVKNLDPTTFSFTFAGLLFFIGMFRYRFLDFVPIARAAVFETMYDSVIVLDTYNRITDINNSARVLFGKNQKNLLGQPVSKILDEDINNLETEKRIMLSTVDGKKYYNIKVSPLLGKKSITIGRLIVLSDITELEETMEKLEKSKVMAESANKAKSEFLATMSHEIRTPLNGIIGMAELMENASLTIEERENLHTLRYSADSLLEIINEILDFSKIESGKMEIENTSFNIRDLIHSTVMTFSYKDRTQPIDFTYNIEKAVPDILSGDPLRLRQILINLLSNAFKFTQLGKIEVKVDCIKRTDAAAHLEFSVSDTGIGIPQDKINSLFESFHQLDSSTTRKYGGTGLGLSIVKKLIELMGGSIKVKSQPGKGSTFLFEIPFKVVQADATPQVLNSTDTDYSIRELKILVAEDSRVNQLVLIQFLKNKQWMADTAENGVKVLEKLESNTYDLILMDIQMPEMDGYEAAKRIRENERGTGAHIPIIALTANATENDRNKCIECGMDDFISKPVKSEKLYSCILKHVGTYTK